MRFNVAARSTPIALESINRRFFMADDEVIWRRVAVKEWGAEMQPGDHTTPQRALTMKFPAIAAPVSALLISWKKGEPAIAGRDIK